MTWLRKIITILTFLLPLLSYCQHPNRNRIDSLKKVLKTASGIERIDCLNALSEEYWWPPRVFPDSISCWAIPAYKAAIKSNYQLGYATATMHWAVSELFRKNCYNAETYLLKALSMFTQIKNEKGIGWCNLWLGQTLYSENKFKSAIDYCNTSLGYLDKLNDWEGKGKAWAWLGFLYAAMGNYDSSFEYCDKSLKIREKMSDKVCVAAALTNMGHLYRMANDYDDALDYYSQGLQFANTYKINLHEASWNYLDEPMGIVYRLMNKPDSSIYYLQKAIEIDPANLMTQVSLGETLMSEKNYDEALPYFKQPIAKFRKQSDKWDLMRVLLDAGKAYVGKENYQTALPYILEGFKIANEANVKQYVLQGYLLWAETYEQLGHSDSAYELMQRYTVQHDSLMNRQLLWRLANYKHKTEFEKKTQQILVLNKDNQLKDEKLKKASLWTLVLIIGIFLILLLCVVVYLNLSLKRKNEQLKNSRLEQTMAIKQLESERKHSELQQRTTQLETSILRTQMTPHFIFNSLNSINRFVLKNDKIQASEFLTKFSKLMRMILQYSQYALITLEQELEALKLYLDLECLRFDYHFTFKISVPDNMDASALKIPPLSIQPFVENSIWHGLMHKEEKGHLDIEINEEDDFISIKIADDGIGRAAAEHTNKPVDEHKGVGMTITKQRIAMLKNNTNEKKTVVVNDLYDSEGKGAGTEVIIQIPKLI